MNAARIFDVYRCEYLGVSESILAIERGLLDPYVWPARAIERLGTVLASDAGEAVKTLVCYRRGARERLPGQYYRGIAAAEKGASS
jgi:hypothetical protein